MLKTIEQKTGKPITELFDWVVGTSTGGVLALGMIYGETIMHGQVMIPISISFAFFEAFSVRLVQ